ncbi:histidine phosphatase family protein [Shewanella maritima]|uniref:histidine phosphatase family protein n=1 Tax=Shewanella maritima TaxID=2520507 RepID=UPI0037356651
MKQLKLWVLRHGHCQGGQILRGKTDVALSEQGWQQMQHALHSLPCVPAKVYHSPLQRCAKVSQVYAKQHVIQAQALSWLSEMDFGDWDGVEFDALYQDYPDEVELFWREPWSKAVTPNNAETMVEFAQRVTHGFTTLLQQCFADNDLFSNSALDANGGSNPPTMDKVPTLLLVTHGGVMKLLMNQLLGLGESNSFFSQLSLPYAAQLEIDVFYDESIMSESKLHLSDETNAMSGVQAASKIEDTQFFAKQGLQFQLHWPSLITG